MVIEPNTFWDWVPGSWCGADRSILYFPLLYFFFSLSLLGYVISCRWQKEKKKANSPRPIPTQALIILVTVSNGPDSFSTFKYFLFITFSFEEAIFITFLL